MEDYIAQKRARVEKAAEFARRRIKAFREREEGRIEVEYRKKEAAYEERIRDKKAQLEDVEKSITRRRAELAIRKGLADKDYFVGELRGMFSDYDPFGQQDDINSRVIAKLGNNLYKAFVDEDTNLEKEELVNLVREMSKVVERRGHDFGRAEIARMIKEARWLAKKITTREELEIVKANMKRLGGPRNRVSFRDFHGYFADFFKAEG